MLEADIAALRRALVSTAGGYLRNPVRQDNVTCSVCTTPVDGYKYCFPCQNHLIYSGLADAVGPLTYAVAGRQSGYVMRGYKAASPVEEHYLIVGMLILLGLSMHTVCAGNLAGMSVTHWSTVPSLPAKPGEHPLHKIVRGQAPGDEVPLVAAATTASPRSINPDHFSTEKQLRPESHVLLIDDTWTKGGHAQSAALALRAAGAAHVSVLVVARWINSGYADNAKFLRDFASSDYDPSICPWTGASCR